MKRSFWTVFCALTLLLSSAVPAGAFEIGARALYWFPTMKADMKADSDAKAGTDLNLKDNLGVGSESFPTFEAFGGVGKHRLSLAYTPIKYSGSTRLASPVNFNGQTFAAGSDVNTDLKLRMLDLEYQYKFLDLENILAGFSLSAIGQIKYIDGEAKMEAPATATSADFTVRVPIPMVGVGAHIGLLAGLLEARAKVDGRGLFPQLSLRGAGGPFLDPLPLPGYPRRLQDHPAQDRSQRQISGHAISGSLCGSDGEFLRWKKCREEKLTEMEGRNHHGGALLGKGGLAGEWEKHLQQDRPPQI